ncbi:hypothetical protein DFH09DRAFT_1083777 [Mycena vulgaris]|nr:hypothetical protein DFH09DRAFT_1083777 [Mycena vulgaris]
MPSILYFEFQERTVLFQTKGQNIPSYNEAIAFCRHPEVFGVDEGVEIEFMVKVTEEGEPAIVTSLAWDFIQPGHVLHVVMSPRAKLVHGIIEQLKTNAALATGRDTIILIDEGQATYSDLTLWNTYFKGWAGDLSGPFGVIIACSYGSVSPHVMASGPYTPINLEDSQRIELRRSSDNPLGLLFDQAEMDELFDLAVAAKVMPPTDQPLRQLVFQWTEGYISVVVAIVKMMGTDKQKIRANEIYTLSQFLEAYPQKTLFATLAANGQCRRFLPSYAVAADPRIIRVFSRLLVDGQIEYEVEDQSPGGLDREDLDFAHEKGLIYLERTSASSLSCRISFTFPLQRGLLQMSLRPPIPDLLDNTPTLFSLVTEVRPRALASAEYSTPAEHTPAGRIDFLVYRREINDKERSWGIELLRDGDRLQEHAYRFDPTGAYHSMISDGMTEFV